MSELPCQTDETTRLARLRDYRILYTHPENTYDRLARLAALTLGVPMAVIGILDADQVWFKARIGVEAKSVPRSSALCARMAASYDPLIIPDTHLDVDYRDSPLVRESPHIRFFTGMPLHTADGLYIGGLCVMDCVPHPMPGPTQLASLHEITRLVMEELELRRLQDMPHQGASSGHAHRNLLAAYTAKSEFLTSLSHELRTPLNAITGYAGLIAADESSAPGTVEHAQEIMAAARHMLSLVNDILEYGRLEAGNLSIGWQRVLLRPVVEAALHMVAVFAASRGIRLIQDIAWPQAALRGDPVRLKQVLLNLLTNAIKFTPRGGLVTVRLAHGPGDTVELSVIDTGIGIAANDISRTLTPFGQVVPKEGPHVEGTGLGLPIAKALIERQGGSLHLESQPGQGTSVRILLPALTTGADAPALTTGANAPA